MAGAFIKGQYYKNCENDNLREALEEVSQSQGTLSLINAPEQSTPPIKRNSDVSYKFGVPNFSNRQVTARDKPKAEPQPNANLQRIQLPQQHNWPAKIKLRAELQAESSRLRQQLTQRPNRPAILKSVLQATSNLNRLGRPESKPKQPVLFTKATQLKTPPLVKLPAGTPAVPSVPLLQKPSTNIPLNPKDVCNLQWSEYSEKFSGRFVTLWEAQDLVDVTLGVEGRYIQAHKLVLSVCSDYFRDLFKINPCQHPIVILKDVEYESLHAVIQFMYCGEVQITTDKLPGLLRTAQLLKVKGLNSEDFSEKTSNNASEVTSPSPPTSQKTKRPENTMTMEQSNDAKKRKLYAIPSNVKVKIIRSNKPEILAQPTQPPELAQITVAKGVPPFQPPDTDNFVSLPSTSKPDFFTYTPENADIDPLADEKPDIVEIFETDPIKVENEGIETKEFEFFSDNANGAIGFVGEFPYETIEECDSDGTDIDDLI